MTEKFPGGVEAGEHTVSISVRRFGGTGQILSVVGVLKGPSREAWISDCTRHCYVTHPFPNHLLSGLTLFDIVTIHTHMLLGIFERILFSL